MSTDALNNADQTEKGVSRRVIVQRMAAAAAGTVLPKSARMTSDALIEWPRLRGTSFETGRDAPSPAMARQFARWGMNAVRINVGSDAFANHTIDETHNPAKADDPLAAYRVNIQHIKAFTAQCALEGIGVILAADQIYGRRLDYFTVHGGDAFRDGLKAELCRFWDAVARVFRDDPAIIAFDALNEPNYAGSNPSQATPAIWTDDVLPAVISTIRAVHSTIPIIVMPWPWGLPPGFSSMKAVADNHIIYSFHSYAPFRYTHQGIKSMVNTRGTLTWPGLIAEYDTSVPHMWDSEAYRRYIRPALDFRDRYGVRLLVGEWGCVRWAPGNDAYVRDVLAIFEEEGLDWLYHSFGSWNGWNPTYPPGFSGESAPSTVDGGYSAPAVRTLMSAYARNRKFAWKV